jgi:hypothetical protein
MMARMKRAFAHDAVLDMSPDADLRAPGAAITKELCGHWHHEPPCPVAPHHTDAERVGERVHVRTLFAAEPDAEREVRQRIDRALSGRWHLVASRHSEVTAGESEHGERLVRS